MPGNTIIINNSKGLEWYIGDSKIPKLIKFLKKYGIKNQDKIHSSQRGQCGQG